MAQRRLLSHLLVCSAIACSQLPATLLDLKDDDRPYDEQFSPTSAFVLPWLTGPLLASSGHVIPVGHINIEPYLFTNVITGGYDSRWKSHDALHNFYNINTEIPIQVGIIKNWDFAFTPQFSWNHVHGASHWVLNDLPIALSYQLLNDTPNSWWPAIKLTLRASIPWGKYQKLDPKNLGTDAGGAGSWFPGVGLTFSRLFHFKGVHFLAARLSSSYAIPNSVHVKGLNTYGGGDGTNGTVYPGPFFSTDLAFEYTLTQNWALALDVLYVHNNHTRFSGHKGSTYGIPNSVGGPSSEQFSLAPALEYNWSSNCGVIAGVWFSVAGRNTADFINGVVAINIYR